MNWRNLALTSSLALACLGTTVVWAAEDAHHRIVTPDQLEWTEVPSIPPGAQVAVIEGPMDQDGPVTARLRLPADYAIPPHWHPGVERVTVLSGTFNIGMGEAFDREKTQALEQGGMVIIQPETPHFVWTDEETIIQINSRGPWSINYVDEADDPRNR